MRPTPDHSPSRLATLIGKGLKAIRDRREAKRAAAEAAIDPTLPAAAQVVEVAKLGLVTYLAYSLGRKAELVKTFTVGFVPHLVVCGVMMVLLLKQPDLGSSIVIGATTLGMLFMAGTRVSYIMLAILGA